MKQKLIFASLYLFSVGVFAVPEQHVPTMFNPMIKAKWQNSKNHLGTTCATPARGLNLHGMTYDVCAFETRTGLIKASPSAKIRYTKYYLKNAAKKGPKGTLVIAPGRTESSLKYIEVAYDFLKRGYSPVYAIDHRSQGYSSRTLPNKHKVNTANFDNYVDDFKKFIDTVVLTDAHVNKDKMFLISNSMGGAITALYLEEDQGHPFKATAMFGAMHKISFPKPFTEFLARLAANVICTAGKIGPIDCTGYAPGKGRNFDEEARIFENNTLTHSWNRYELRNELWRTRPYLATGGVTYRWVKSATNRARRLRRNASKIKIPMLVVTASEDPIVDPQGHIKVCNNAPKCAYRVAKGSRHEVLMESDSFRRPWMGNQGRGGILFDFLENPESYVGN